MGAEIVELNLVKLLLKFLISIDDVSPPVDAWQFFLHYVTSAFVQI
jgi:hypothetical protein